MKRRVIIGSLLVVALAGLAWFLLDRSPPEPVYKGKTVSQWLDTYAIVKLTTGPLQSGAGWDEADEAFHAMGTNAIPHLLRILTSHDSALKLRLVGLARLQGLVKINFVPATTRIPWVGTAFFAIGANQAAVAAPAVTDIYEHNADPLTRAIAARILGDIGPPARQAVPALLRNSTNVSETLLVRETAIRALAAIHAESGLVVPAMIQILKEPSAQFRMDAVSVLSNFGPDAKAAVPDLIQILKTQGNDPRAMAEFKRQGYDLKSMNMLICRAIQKIDPETAAARSAEIDAALNAAKGQ